MINTGHALADSGLHQTTERWQYVDRRIDLPVVQRPVHEHLTLCDVAGEIRNRVCDVIVGHGQNRELRDGTIATLNAAGPLVDRGQISVHVPWVSAPAWH